MTSAPILYDLITKDGAALSPWCWHAKMALAHKGIAAEVKPLDFTQKDQVIAAGGKSFPLMVEADGTVSDDSKIITDRLEEICPTPTLFPGGAASHAAYDFMHRYVQTILFPTVVKIILKDIPDVLDGADRDYFIESRTTRFGKSLDEVCAQRDAHRETLSTQLDPFRKALAKGGFISGDTPAMADYLLFGVMQWARVCSPYALISADDALTPWMESLLDLHGGLGRATPAAS
ncbi:MAG: glutathione S-transferase C-terminal domain-containing protein [Alphaproteobacteria bacterium]|nr:glutathione S-transferase C-terminal domain-containing protein [Alphaproteobacteria bacterium]